MKASRWMMTLAGSVILSLAGTVGAGNLMPPGAPGPTMHTLEDIYQQLSALQQQIMDMNQRLANMEQRLISGGMHVSSQQVRAPRHGGKCVGVVLGPVLLNRIPAW